MRLSLCVTLDHCQDFVKIRGRPPELDDRPTSPHSTRHSLRDRRPDTLWSTRSQRHPTDGSDRTVGRLRRRQRDGSGLPARRWTERRWGALAAIDGCQHRSARTHRSVLPAGRRAHDHLRQVEQGDHDHTERQPRQQHDHEKDVDVLAQSQRRIVDERSTSHPARAWGQRTEKVRRHRGHHSRYHDVESSPHLGTTGGHGGQTVSGALRMPRSSPSAARSATNQS